ncbi:MAG: hypothetical protein V4555_20735 [Acidobacteriota bacterium]
MPPQPIPPELQQNMRSLTYDEAWDQIEALFGSAREAFAAVGGGAAFLRSERSAEDEELVR